MLKMLSCIRQQQDMNLVQGVVKNQAAYLTDEHWEYFEYSNISKLKQFLEEKLLLDVICFDLCLDGGIDALIKLREENQKAYIIVIARLDMSPVLYMRPDIMAASLLLHPLQESQVKERIIDMIHYFELEKQDEELFVVEDKEGKVRIPCSKILCFEARNKKIYACTESIEHGFYDTLEQLQERLPKEFIRCHRGFIVNSLWIKKVVFSENVIYLHNGDVVPLSRSYKSSIKEYLNGREN